MENSLVVEIQRRVKALPEMNVAALRAIRREYSKQLTKSDAGSVLELALELLKLPEFEFRFIAYELVQHHRQARERLDEAILERLGEGMDSWVAVDCFASYLSGPAWRDGRIGNTVVRRWARSPDRWWRRAAVVSTVPLNNQARGGSGDAARTLTICNLVLDDRDDMVVKALSWALRELAKRDATAVREFLSKSAGKLAPRVVREVGNKLETGLKNPRKKN